MAQVNDIVNEKKTKKKIKVNGKMIALRQKQPKKQFYHYSHLTFIF